MTTIHPFRTWLALPLAVAALLSLSPTLPLRAAPSSASASSDMDLNASQKAQMEAGKARFEKAMQALQADTKLTPAQKRTKEITMLQAADKESLAILTPAQRDLVVKQRAVDAKYQAELAVLRADTKMTDPQKQARFETLMRDRQNALLATLPPAQRARAERAHQATLARAAKARQIGEQLQKSLSKTTQGQIQQITMAARSQMQAVSADTTLSQPGKAAKIQALGHEAEAKINALLTPKQRVQFAHYHELVSPSAPQ